MAMFKSPTLALCNNRNVKAKVRPNLGEPEAWFEEKTLRDAGLRGIRSFEFFVNWGSNSQEIQPVFWRKQNPSANFPNWENVDSQELLAALRTDLEFVDLVRFGKRHGFEVSALIYNGEADWQGGRNAVRMVSIKPQADIQIELLNLEQLQDRIKTLSGGPVSVGRKGLIYGTTTLECLLSTTDAAWPGDADLLLTDRDYNPKALVEFKKHTINADIVQQRLSRYYPNPDQRKYRRLALLRDRLGLSKNSGFVCLYYSVHKEERRVKIEKIIGQSTNLQADGEIIVEVNADGPCDCFTESLIDAILQFS